MKLLLIGNLLVTALLPGAGWADRFPPDPRLEDSVCVDVLPKFIGRAIPAPPEGPIVSTNSILVHALVGRDGRVKETRILTAGEPLADSAAMAIVRRCVFKPALSKGALGILQTVPIWAVMSVHFKHDGSSVVWMAGTAWGTKVPPRPKPRPAPRGSARAVCDSLREHFFRLQFDRADRNRCELHDNWSNPNGGMGRTLRDYLDHRGWSEIRAWSADAAGLTRFTYRRGDLLFMVVGEWDRDPNDDVYQPNSDWQIVVARQNREQRRLIQEMDRQAQPAAP
jgi:TonB family protein